MAFTMFIVGLVMLLFKMYGGIAVVVGSILAMLFTTTTTGMWWCIGLTCLAYAMFVEQDA
jgi:hypothetical protein